MSATNQAVFDAFATGEPLQGARVSSVELPNGQVALYSYATPVAVRQGDAAIFGDERYSPTTSKHCRQAWRTCFEWGVEARTWEQDYFVRLLRLAGAENLGRAA